MIKLENITKSYRQQGKEITALYPMSLDIRRGEIFGVIGRSGAGKSTLIRCVNLLERPTSGSVVVAGKNLMQLSPKELRQARHQIGMVFQHFNLLNSSTVFENVAFPLRLMKLSTLEIEKRVKPLIERVGLESQLYVYPNQLSGGQKQRVAIARALITKPQVLLCDEMTSALDPQTTNEILQLVGELNKELLLTILFITHEMDVIKKIANRVAVLEQGRLVEQGTVIDLFKNPKTDSAKKLTQASLHIQLPEKIKEKLKATPPEKGSCLLKLVFSGDVATEPVIDSLIRQFDVSVNILQAHLDFLQQQPMGMMILAINVVSSDAIKKVDIFLNEKGLQTEVIGYVAANDE